MAARVEQQDDLVHAAGLVAAQELPHGVGRADRTATRTVGQRRILLDRFLVALPDLGPARGVHAGQVVVHDAEREEAATGAEPLERLVVTLGHHHRQIAADGQDVRVDRRCDRRTLLLEVAVVPVDTVLERFRSGVGEAQCADRLLGGHLHRRRSGAGHPDRRVRLLQRLGHHVAGRHFDVLALVSTERFFGHAPDRDLERLFPLGALVRGVDVEAAELGNRGALAGAVFHPAVGQMVQRGDTFGDSRGRVDVRQQMHDAEPQPDVLGALTGRGQEHLRGRRMTVLLEEVVLGEPYRGEAGPVGRLDLGEAVLEQLVLVVLRPGSRQREFVEQGNFHCRLPPWSSG